MRKWTAADIPPQDGRTAVVTGTGGLGFETALALARAGAKTIIAGRNLAKGADAAARISAELPSAHVRFELLDLASLASVAAFAARLADREEKLDLLINNAGVMVPPRREVTKDGFELQFGTNYLGHFALTQLLLPQLRRAGDARVVSLSSVAARSGGIDLDDLNAEKSYRPMPAYSQSKLACLMFGLELQRRSIAGGWGVKSIIAHPGVARTDLLHNAPGRWSGMGLARTLLWFLFQPAPQGALPTLFAATSADAEPGGYYGPDALGETRGYPAPARIPPAALDRTAARALWETSDKLVHSVGN
ncbi:SDR family oxidoreductase [Sphingomonas sp. Sphisp140]|uniref:SDR family oxidoreductase n=1 Tax=unclassified Sphingomonas TaxID=196159 RepID=UPI0039AEC772